MKCFMRDKELRADLEAKRQTDGDPIYLRALNEINRLVGVICECDSALARVYGTASDMRKDVQSVREEMIVASRAERGVLSGSGDER